MAENTRTIGIVGTGIIASSLAVLTTGHGFKTVVFSRSEASTNRFMNDYSTHFKSMMKKELITKDQVDICRSYLTVANDYESMSEAEAVFECAIEEINTKHEIYSILENTCKSLKAICSVSSSIVPDILCEGHKIYGDRIIVTHPFNPVHMVPYFELCGGTNTAEGVIDYAVSLLDELDRKPVVLNKPTPGFIGNRLQFALWREALALVEEGICSPEAIDTALMYSFCPRYTSIGIFEHFDNGGYFLNSETCKHLFPILSDEKELPKSIKNLLDTGRTGVKAGEGFYNWENTDMEAYRERVSAPYWKFCKWNLPDKKL